jgi:transcriptional antiterminator NusG
MAKKWYVLRVQSGREDSVKESLLKRVQALKLEELVGRVVVPTEKVSEIKGGKRRIAERKIYPGYIMVELETEDTGRIPERAWFMVKETPGIGDFVGSRRKPVPMKDTEVARMLEAMEEKEEAPKIKIGFRSGDSVRIKEGPFENFDGYVEEINPGKGLVKVIVTIFGRATPIELEYWQIEAI